MKQKGYVDRMRLRTKTVSVSVSVSVGRTLYICGIYMLIISSIYLVGTRAKQHKGLVYTISGEKHPRAALIGRKDVKIASCIFAMSSIRCCAGLDT
jgi:hypothetical protein